MSTPTLSIVIPARNAVATLPYLLTALGRQAPGTPAFEVIVVDDDSTDGTGDAVTGGSYDFDVHCLAAGRHEASCRSAIRNIGLRHASGEVVVFLDADVMPGPGFVAAHAAAHRRSDVKTAVPGYVYGYSLIPEERTPDALDPPPPAEILATLPTFPERASPRWHDGRHDFFNDRELVERMPQPWIWCWSNNISLPRQFADELGGFDEDYVGWGHEDIDLGIRVTRSGGRVQMSKDAWGVHYPHPLGPDSGRFDGPNLRLLLRKHPDPHVELWAAKFARFGDDEGKEARAELRALLERRIQVPALDLPLAVELLDRYKQRGKCAWFGPRPEGLPPSCRPDYESDPLNPDRDDDTPRLLGIALPFDRGELAAALVIDYWRHLGPEALAAVCAELGRVAAQVVLVASPAATDDDAAAPSDAARALERLGTVATTRRRGSVVLEWRPFDGDQRPDRAS